MVCKRSYWLYTDQGGVLEVLPDIVSMVKKGEVVARLRNLFGDVLAEYTAPEEGIVIGENRNPVGDAAFKDPPSGDYRRGKAKGAEEKEGKKLNRVHFYTISGETK